MTRKSVNITSITSNALAVVIDDSRRRCLQCIRMAHTTTGLYFTYSNHNIRRKIKVILKIKVDICVCTSRVAKSITDVDNETFTVLSIKLQVAFMMLHRIELLTCLLINSLTQFKLYTLDEHTISLHAGAIFMKNQQTRNAYFAEFVFCSTKNTGIEVPKFPTKLDTCRHQTSLCDTHNATRLATN